MGPLNLDVIDGSFIPSAQIADEVGVKKDTLQRRVRRGYYQGVEIAGKKQEYDARPGGKDIQLKVWHGRKTVCYSKSLYFFIVLGEQSGRREFDFDYNFQDRVTAASYRKNFDSLLARLRRELDTNDALSSKARRLLHLLRVLVISQTEDYADLLRWFEGYEPEDSKLLRQVLRGKDQGIL